MLMNLGDSKKVKDYFAKFTKFVNITNFPKLTTLPTTTIKFLVRVVQ